MFFSERVLLGIVWGSCFISIWFIPKEKRAVASFVFLITQSLTWIAGLIVVEFNWIEYPVRELAKASSTSFSFEYFILPLLTVFFVLYYPDNKKLIRKIIHFATFSSALTLIEVLVEKFTLLITYHSWTWYWTWLSVPALFYLVMCIYRWFFKIKGIFSI
ncbi:MAG TPA: CBO0543 family protein [Pseudobacteroides sp.]|uniref:CBO0543 family protein n=1 Tax=Pseudobacteroides sp. TaxID=1968840 RepID=UPI002F92DD21